MALSDELKDGIDWPPDGHEDRIVRQHRYGVLYRNRADELLQHYSPELIGYAQKSEDLIPYPSAKIAARTLAAFLFAEAPTISHDDDAADERLTSLAEDTNLASTLVEAALTQGYEGEVYLHPAWDVDVDPRHAIINAVPGHQAVPVFRFGRLVEVAFVTTHVDDKRGSKRSRATYWRHIAYYEPGGGAIRHRLYQGTSERLGASVNLDQHPSTAYLADGAGGTEVVEETGLDELPVAHVPLGRDSSEAHGVSILDGLEDIILGMHRLYSQEQHDAEIARRRIAVVEGHLARDASGRPTFGRGDDLLVLTEDASGAIGEGQGKPVVPIEFRDDNVMGERIGRRLADFLIACGISPYTIKAEEVGGAVSGTSRKLAQSLTLQTVAMVARYWQHELARLLPLAVRLEATHLPQAQAAPEALGARASVKLGDGLIDDEAELARILADLDTAAAISTKRKVERLHPEWDAEQVADEVDRILDEGGSPAPPSPGTPFGDLTVVDDEDEDEEPVDDEAAEG